MEDEATDADTVLSSEAARMRLRHQSPEVYLTEQLGETDVERIVTAMDNRFPSASLAIMARWWQLETYLRTLVYIQMHGLLGPSFASKFPKEQRRQGQTGEFGYMASSDDGYLPAQFDVGVLFKLIEEHWDSCRYGIGLPKQVWLGRVNELAPVRHRLAHCRRPHADDASRIEQVMRDLEPAANRFLRAYTNWSPVDVDLVDPVVEDWARMRHVDAHLVEHGRERRGVEFELRTVSLPGTPTDAVCVSGSPGRFWVMHAIIRQGGLFIDDYMRESSVQNLLSLATHIVQPSQNQIAVTIPAVGDPTVISEVIGGFLAAVFSARTKGDERYSVRHPTRRFRGTLDPRVDAQGILSVLSWLDADDSCSIFG
jgi:hypothetical protein